MLQEEEEEDDDAAPDDTMTGRAAVNRSIAQEQAALRARAAAAAKEEDIYDYDNAYDSFHAPPAVSSGHSEAPRTSRYIQDLMQAAELRKIERDIAQERKVARELTAEEAVEPELRHKERFVTASYQRKLQERKLWQERQEEQDQLDAAAQPDGEMAMASFYGNMTRKNMEAASLKEKQMSSNHPMIEVSTADGVEPSLLDANNIVPEDIAPEVPQGKEFATKEEDAVQRRNRIRQLRQEKVQQARHRYIKRHGLDASAVAF